MVEEDVTQEFQGELQEALYWLRRAREDEWSSGLRNGYSWAEDSALVLNLGVALCMAVEAGIVTPEIVAPVRDVLLKKARDLTDTSKPSPTGWSSRMTFRVLHKVKENLVAKQDFETASELNDISSRLGELARAAMAETKAAGGQHDSVGDKP